MKIYNITVPTSKSVVYFSLSNGFDTSYQESDLRSVFYVWDQNVIFCMLRNDS